MTGLTMTRQSISLTDPNDSWLKDQIEKQEFSSKSELINALVRKARHEDERQATSLRSLHSPKNV
jgi:antitoxin ParD1/3/4